MIKAQEKDKIIKKFASHDNDTGSSGVQVALFSKEIERLSSHLKKHQKDNSSRLGLLKMVNKRRKLLDFLKKENPKDYGSVIKDLGLKR